MTDMEFKELLAEAEPDDYCKCDACGHVYFVDEAVGISSNGYDYDCYVCPECKS